MCPAASEGEVPSAEPPEDALDASLVRAARDGSPTARGRLFEALQPGLVRYLEGKIGPRLGRAVSAADLAQDAFAECYRSLHRLSVGAGVDDLKGLLWQHAHWRLHKAARKHRDFLGESNVGAPLPVAVPARGTGETTGPVTRQDRSGWLQRQLERLGPDDARVLRLRGRGLGFDEIAAELGIQREAAKKRCLRATGRLRELLEGGPPGT